ncbi:MAG: hypothetical protein LBM73_01840 [Candidatus Nomurabacteria bacterium]|jgi:hypothetical protein|nr:hypothetical protein [Candidatus Nomurabacteria bacterium]
MSEIVGEGRKPDVLALGGAFQVGTHYRQPSISGAKEFCAKSKFTNVSVSII